MDLSRVLTYYSSFPCKLPVYRYAMYLTGVFIFGCCCTIFSLLVSEYPGYSVFGVVLLLLLVVWHPYYYSLSAKHRLVLRYAFFGAWSMFCRAKPFISLFFLGYMVAVPACIFCYLGFGRSGSLGTLIYKSLQPNTQLTFYEIAARSESLKLDRDYFVTNDGFVAFNLSKSVVHTSTSYPLQSTDTLFSGLSNPVVDQIFGQKNVSYSDSYVSEVPLFDVSPILHFPDVRSRWTVAPIFASRANCLEGYAPVHVTCMLSNKILGWAYSTDVASFCRSIDSSACESDAIVGDRLSVYYPDPFNESMSPKVGISGIVASAPPDFIVDALQRRFIADGWPIEADTVMYPSGVPAVWIQVIPDVVNKMNSASNQFNIFKYISIGLIISTVLLMLVPFFLDVKTDLLVLKLINHQKEVLSLNAEEARQRDERRRQVELAASLKFE